MIPDLALLLAPALEDRLPTLQLGATVPAAGVLEREVPITGTRLPRNRGNSKRWALSTSSEQSGHRSGLVRSFGVVDYSTVT